MIARALRYETAGLRRSLVVPLTVLFAVGGAMLGRTVTWFGSLLRASEIDELFWLATAGTEIAVPLALLAFVIAAAFVFGRDLSEGTADIVLTSPVDRDAIVIAKLLVLLAWTLALSLLAAGSDAVLRAALSVSAVDPGGAIPLAHTLAAALAGFASLPLIGWVALRFRGVIGATGAGIALFVGAFSLRSFEAAAALPWNAPFALAAGEWSLALLVASALTLLAGIAACLWQVRRLDLV